jgi:hypothetical protein
VKGDIAPLNAGYKVPLPVGDPNFNLCSQLKASFSAGLSLTAKAWLNKWSWSQDVTVDALNRELAYPGSPWDIPKGCSASTGTPDSLLGPGVAKVSDVISGSPNQRGHVAGFVPGKKTWVLSTGLISDAVGTPSQFARVGLQGHGRRLDADVVGAGQVGADIGTDGVAVASGLTCPARGEQRHGVRRAAGPAELAHRRHPAAHCRLGRP